MAANRFFSTAAAIAEIRVAAFADAALSTERDPETGDDWITPFPVRDWLARLRLLEKVPFNNIVADSELLPLESIRFFYLDRAWTDALVQGALSVGTVNSNDRAQLEALYPAIRGEIDKRERQVRVPGSEQVQSGAAGQVTGFLLRSRAVSGWPGLQVRAYRQEVGDDDDMIPESHPQRLKLLRLERLAPAVLLALFDGVPAVVHIEEPRQGIQFGVQLTATTDGNSFSARVDARNVLTATTVAGKTMPISFRAGSPGVLDLRETGAEFLRTKVTHMDDDHKLNGAEFALQMIRFPFRQVFGDPSSPHASPMKDVFRPTIARSFAALTATFKANLKP